MSIETDLRESIRMAELTARAKLEAFNRCMELYGERKSMIESDAPDAAITKQDQRIREAVDVYQSLRGRGPCSLWRSLSEGVKD